MAKDIFSNIIGRGIASGAGFPARTQQARDWYRNAAKAVNRVNERQLFEQNKDRMKTQVVPGSMYLFSYDPKWKDDLPYYDKLPLVFPFKMVSNGFLGLNLHYLEPMLRARMMDGLYHYMTDNKYDERTRIGMSYNLLKQSSKLRYYKPCIKHYLYSHVRSRFMFIYPSEWDMALLMPTARWEKRTGNYVYSQSRRML